MEWLKRYGKNTGIIGCDFISQEVERTVAKVKNQLKGPKFVCANTLFGELIFKPVNEGKIGMLNQLD